ncbi:MAG: response regulator transcription factor [Verrucomicrobiota bacterium]
MTSIVLADDHQLLRQGLVALIGDAPDLELLGEAENGQQLLELAGRTRPDVALVDIAMGEDEIDGFQVAQKMMRQLPRIRIIFLTARKDPAAVARAMKMGVNGYVLKENAFDELAQAIDAVQRGEVFVSSELASKALQLAHSTFQETAKLSPREIEVLQQIANGLTNGEIAAKLGVSLTTIRTHRARIMDKLDIHTAAGLTRYAVERALI